MSDERSQVTEATREAEAEEAQARHVADRPASPEEEALAGDGKVDDEVRTHYRQMTEIGAHEKGEGQVP
jgi:hypothetical protein